MRTSDTIVKIAPALLKAQRKIGGAIKGASNPFFKSKYADLGAVMEACKEALNEEGILVLQPVISEEGIDYVETVLVHESGEYISSRMKLIVSKPDMQAYGSSISYARRYGLQSLMFIPAEDDDGEKAMARPAHKSAVQHAVSNVAAVKSMIAGHAPIDNTPHVEVKVATEVASTVSEVPKSRTTFRKPTPTGSTSGSGLNI
jgi:hypothetical protein